MTGILEIDSPSSLSSIWVQGEDIRKLRASERARLITYVGSETRVEFPVSAVDFVAMGRFCHQGFRFFPRKSKADLLAIKTAMERCRCWEFKDRWTGELSDGEKQRVALARALAQGSRILLLDEALSKMDLDHQAQIGKLLQSLCQEGYLILLVAHDLNLATEWADQCMVLKEGEILTSGPIAQVLNSAMLEKLYPQAALVVGKNPVSGTPKVFFSWG